MPRDLLFSVSGSQATPAREVTLAEAGLKERQDLQEWVYDHPEILGDDIRIVTFEFDRWTSSNGNPRDRLDVLGLSQDGHLVIAELKRDRAPDTVDVQAIKYAAMASRFSPDTLASQHARFLSSRGQATTEEEASALLDAHVVEGALDPAKLRRPKIILLAGSFSDLVTASAIWLREMGVDVTVVTAKAYQSGGQVFISTTQLLPPPDTEDFMISPQAAVVKAVEEKLAVQKDVNQTVRLIASRLIVDGTELMLRPSGVNDEIRSAITTWAAESPSRGLAIWTNVDEPLEWKEDGHSYTPTGLARLIMREAYGSDRNIRGTEWWVMGDGRSLVQVAKELGSPKEKLYVEFWTKLRGLIAEKHPDWIASRTGVATTWNWLESGSNIAGANYSSSFGRAGAVKHELYVDSRDRETNAAVISRMMARRSEIENLFGGALKWSPPSERHRYGSVAALGEGDIEDQDDWPRIMEWFMDVSERLRGALEPSGESVRA